MASGITTQIIIRPYLKDYMINKYGEGKHPIPATTRNKLFPFLFSFLTKTPKNYKPLNPLLPGVLSFELPYNEYLVNIRYNSYISREKFGEIQSFLYGIFYNDFTRHMRKVCEIENFTIKKGIIDFCVSNEISFDYANYDSLKRIYLRYRTRNVKVKKKSTSLKGCF